MKTKFLFHAASFLLFVLFSYPIISFAQGCGDCPKRIVMMYDMDVQVPKPGDPAKIIQWQYLFRAAFTAEDRAFNDPTASCLTFLDGTLVGRDRNISDSIVFGLSHAHTAPQGEIAGSDYLISGSVTGSEGAYEMTISLETVCSRETVTTGSTVFSSASQAAEVGTTLGTQVFSNIATTIEQFEVNKRNTNTDEARDVQDDQMVITPSKTKAARGESVPVHISLVDCDGIPLANRTITLTASQFQGMILNGSENGAFTEQTVTTDANGIAHPNFLTGASPGIAILRAYFIYKNPMGCDRVAGASATIVIEDPIHDAYVIQARYSFTGTFERKWARDILFGYANDKYEAVWKKTINMTAICKNTGAAEGIVELASSSVSVQGSTTDRTETNNYSSGQVPGGPFGETKDYSLWQQDGIVIPGSDEDGKSGVTFIYDPQNPGYNDFAIFGTIILRTRNYEWHYTTPVDPGDVAIVTSNSDETETEGSALSQGVPLDVIGTISVVDSGFVVTLELDSTWEEPQYPGPPFVRHHIISVHATVRPLAEFLTTSIVKEIEEAKGIKLEWSTYPNPTSYLLTLSLRNSEYFGLRIDNLSYQLYDLSGKLLQEKKLENNETSINMEGLVPATYILKVIQNQDNASQPDINSPNELKSFKIIKR